MHTTTFVKEASLLMEGKLNSLYTLGYFTKTCLDYVILEQSCFKLAYHFVHIKIHENIVRHFGSNVTRNPRTIGNSIRDFITPIEAV